jgi:hypothetical protein
MTNEQVIKRINEIREILADYRELTSYDHEALDIAISALSKQSASCEQADKKLFGHGYWLMPGEVFISHNVLNEVLNTIIKSMNTEQRKIDSILAKTDRNDEAIRKDDHIADDSKMVDQFREATKKTDDVLINLPSAQPEIKWETCFDCPLSHGCPKIKGCTNEQAIEYASQIPNDCPLSAQPEIILCKDCTHHHYDKQDIPYCDRKDYGYGWRNEDFCSRAERRNDERMGNS